MERKWGKAAVAYFQPVTEDVSGEARRTSVAVGGLQAEIWHWDLQIRKKEGYSHISKFSVSYLHSMETKARQ
jgi:hypothetical protein